MGFLKVIRRWALREKMPIRQIARRTGVSRNTIKKYLREGIVEPAFQVPDRPSKLDPYAKHLRAWLTTDQRKSRKERRTAKLMHADLVKLGYDGSYERVAAFVREWKGERQRAHHTTDRGTLFAIGSRTMVERRQPSTGFHPERPPDRLYVLPAGPAPLSGDSEMVLAAEPVVGEASRQSKENVSL